MFDVCLMNPPYDRSLHLKFLEKTIKSSNKVISIQPIRWLQDPTAEYKNASAYKKYEHSISSHIYDLDIKDASEMSSTFSIESTINLGIFCCDQNKHNLYKHIKYIRNNKDYSFVQRILERIIKDDNFNKLDIRKFSKDLINFIPLNNMSGENISRCKPTNVIKEWTKPYHTSDEYEYDKSHKSGVARGSIENDNCVIFETYKEACNCFNSFTKCNFTRFYMSFIVTDIHIYHQFMPWVDDYTEEWTDERFYEYFNMSNNEIKIIEEYAENVRKRL